LLALILLFGRLSTPTTQEIPEPLMVDLEQLPLPKPPPQKQQEKPKEQLKKPERSQPEQIVSEPQSPDQKPLDQTPFEAEKDHAAEKQQVARGLGQSPYAGPQNDSVAKPDPAKRASKPEPAQMAAPKTVPHATMPHRTDSAPVPPIPANLKLEPSDLLSELSKTKPPTEPRDKSAQELASKLDEAINLAGGGTPDKLPSVADGNVTLLNAKANRFAVFVRRVAYRVFTQLRQSGWESLNAQQIGAIHEPVVISAELSLKGDPISVTIARSSGSSYYDQLVQQTIKSSIRDPNPPPAAAGANGNIRFIFQSQTWSSNGSSRGAGGGIMEQRWMELGTGLE
jgi:TonB family protein